jgi:hypothetical protein
MIKKIINSHFNSFLFLVLIIFVGVARAQFHQTATFHPKELEAHDKIALLYSQLDNNWLMNASSEPHDHNAISGRLARISAEFLGSPYLLGPIGEGLESPYDQFPRYRMDAFDCETFVTTVMALAFSKNVVEFADNLRRIRYSGDSTDYLQRNHFTDLDWNLNNAKKGYVRDFTESIRDEKGQAVTKIATAIIDKPTWYQFHSKSNIRLNHAVSDDKLQTLLADLRGKGASLAKTQVSVPYVPFTALFNERNEPNLYLFSQIPDAAIVEIVRPNWDLQKKIGTNLNISHLGFVFWEHGNLLFRQASSQYGWVVDVPLIRYLQEARKSPTIKGIHIEVVLNPKEGHTMNETTT